MNIDELETGDMILFNGNYMLSKVIEYFTNSIYSHIGVIIKDPCFENLFLKDVKCLTV